MWYVADLLFAKKPKTPEPTVTCETSSVLFEAASAIDAYRKSLPWAKEHSRDTDFHFIGIQHLRRLDEERPGDGTEIAGGFCEEVDPWGRLDELIPDPNELSAIYWEKNSDTPVGELMSEEQKRTWERVFGDK